LALRPLLAEFDPVLPTDAFPLVPAETIVDVPVHQRDPTAHRRTWNLVRCRAMKLLSNHDIAVRPQGSRGRSRAERAG